MYSIYPETVFGLTWALLSLEKKKKKKKKWYVKHSFRIKFGLTRIAGTGNIFDRMNSRLSFSAIIRYIRTKLSLIPLNIW